MLILASFLTSHPELGAFGLFFALTIGHALGDFALQGDFLSQAKIRNSDLSRYFPKKTPCGVWFCSLTAHSLIHAGAVLFITGSVACGMLEFILHWVIDLAKGEDKISFLTDQILHIASKVLIVLLLV